jgi:hypothetical protein
MDLIFNSFYLFLDYYQLKGTFSRDFLPLIFFIKHLPLAHYYTPQSVFAYNLKFAEILEVEVDSAVSRTPLSQKVFLGNQIF